MRVAVLSDVHGNIAALDAVLDDVSGRAVDAIVNLGDSLSGPFDAVATADRLIALDMPTVSGNHDRALVDREPAAMGLWETWIIDDLSSRHLDWVRGLPPTLDIGGVFLCHGTPASDSENWLDRRSADQRLIARDHDEVAARLGGVTAPVICCGHTHTPRVVRLPGGPLIVNPGAVGCPAYLDSRSEPPFVHETGSPDARYAILEIEDTDVRVALLAVPYDSREMAAMARAKDAESWARAVETGWITASG